MLMWWKSEMNFSFFIPCDFPYAVQRAWHAGLALCPGHGLLVRISLGLRPWLPRLRCECLRRGLLRSRVHRFVRRLHSYYDGVRLLVPVHHRLRLLAFPMRTVPLTQFPTARRETSQLPMRSFCT